MTTAQATATRFEVVYKLLASTLAAWRNCIKSNNTLWEYRHNELLHKIEQNILPSGSGIDCGTKIDFDSSDDDCIRLHCSFHHMNDGGMYDGWTEHIIRIEPSFDGIRLKISGINRNDIKEYLHDVFYHCLTSVAKFTIKEN